MNIGTKLLKPFNIIIEIMYITYETVQYSLNGKVPNDLPRPDFKPSKLVRISDMEVVDGSQVNEGYCALSYSWDQSGDILIDKATGKYKRVDEGKRKIISYDNNYRCKI
ncbi:hypothetical protein BDA99DRAFT_607636 [Phascolomyces articulosus]|uniref:Uncharacterized protein n=1 Tax=Phascolomyces articulosus TaxID=60185 RepID=A0AAD5PAZ2_9FUNG|nr:hypothetical protein BDA99DRAFT_607636 [Phascolomyces articulosus]